MWSFRMNRVLHRKGQIWVETVVYTLIGLALIGLVLAILTPQIKEFRDRAIIEQTIESLNTIDSKIVEILDAPGNKRKVALTLERGTLFIDTFADELRFFLSDAHVRYSEPGASLDIGRITVTTQVHGELYNITLGIDYPYNLTFDGADSPYPEEFTPVSIPYDFFVENHGVQNTTFWIDVTEGS